MNTLTPSSLGSRWAAMIPGLAALFALPAPASAQTPQGELTIVASQAIDDNQQTDAHSLEIRIDNGKVTVKRNGKDVPDAQIQRQGGRLVIVDKDGKKLEDIEINLGQGSGLRRQRLERGDGQQRLFQPDEADQATTPKIMLGVHMGEPGPALERHLNLESGQTTLINGLYEGLPAHAAGLSEFDIITKIDGHAPAHSEAIKEVLANKQPGDSVVLTVIHEGNAKEVSIKLAAYDYQAMQDAKLIGKGPTALSWSFPGGGEWGGADFQAIEPLLREHVLIAPEGEGRRRMEMIAPYLEPQVREHIERRLGPRQGQGLEAQIERIDKRMAELEQLLEQLVEQQKNR